MHAMHARLPKNFVLEERLERYAPAIELEPARLKGNWTKLCYPAIGKATQTDETTHTGEATHTGETTHAGEMTEGSYDELFLDLGCGKGIYLAGMARLHPNTLFVGIDSEPICVAYAAQRIVEQKLPNAVVVAGLARNLPSFFTAHELNTIQLNFPTPFPRKRDAARRVVNYEHLMLYRELLSPTGVLRLRTDSLPLRDFALDELAHAGFEVIHRSDDARAERPDEPLSEYEQRLCEQGARVYELVAHPSGNAAQTPRKPVSLMDYLPQDLDSLDYVPHGMQAAVTNLRNRKANARAKARIS
ncbi:MAG: methyltransferase domain-containing protein [Atopobiaceae bacterium]|nr:methyltransferase domain-containing protein [Atopobiaceae bacterium]